MDKDAAMHIDKDLCFKFVDYLKERFSWKNVVFCCVPEINKKISSSCEFMLCGTKEDDIVFDVCPGYTYFMMKTASSYVYIDHLAFPLTVCANSKRIGITSKNYPKIYETLVVGSVESMFAYACNGSKIGVTTIRSEKNMPINRNIWETIIEPYETIEQTLIKYDLEKPFDELIRH